MSESALSGSRGEETEVKLRREMSLFNGVTIIVGSIIGSGIFVSPIGVLLASSGSVGVSLLIWIASGLISLFGALCYAELGTTISSSGGDYAYIKEAFGNFLAFLQLWVNLIVIRPTAQAIISITFANYALQPVYATCEPPVLAVQFIAALCISFLAWVNIFSVKFGLKTQDLFTVTKLLALILIIITGIVKLCMGKTENMQNLFDSTEPITVSGISVALYSGLFAYFGWNSLNCVTEEMKNPRRNLPCSIYISMTIVTVAYTLANVAYFVVLTPFEILHSNAVAVTFADRVYSFMSWIMPVFVSLSCFGGVNGLLFTSGRLNFVGAREGQLPVILAMIHAERFTPVTAILSTALLSLVMLLIPDVFVLITYVSFVNWLSVGSSICGMLWLRYKRPEIPRPICLPLFIPVLFIVFVVFLIVTPAISKPYEMLMGTIIVLSGIPVYLFGVCWHGKPKSFLKICHYCTIGLQKAFHVVPQN